MKMIRLDPLMVVRVTPIRKIFMIVGDTTKWSRKYFISTSRSLGHRYTYPGYPRLSPFTHPSPFLCTKLYLPRSTNKHPLNGSLHDFIFAYLVNGLFISYIVMLRHTDSTHKKKKKKKLTLTRFVLNGLVDKKTLWLDIVMIFVVYADTLWYSKYMG